MATSNLTDASQIMVESDGPARIIRFARPEAHNALTDTMLLATRAAMQACELDNAVVAIVLTGDDKAFCAGGDVKGTAASQMPPFDKYRYRYTQSVWHEFMRFLGHYSKPVIAAVEGYAFGGGLEIMLRCDFAIGSETAKLGLTEARLGLFPILGGAWLLTRAIGEKKARELAYTGRRIDAQTALELGLFNQLTPAGGACAKAVDIVQEMTHCAPLAIMAVKAAINRAPRQTFDEALCEGGDLSALMMFSEDRQEGLQAFLDKRKPQFKGK